MSKETYKVVTRESPLALWQTHHVIALLKEKHPQLHFEIVKMQTKGDRILDQALSAIGDKGLFTLELEEAMLAGDVDFAVHSLKDMPTALPKGLWLSAMPQRQDHRDALLCRHANSVEDLKPNAVVGTSSLRRKSQLLHHRPDLQVKDLRGNVNTRLRKYHEGQYDAVILAAAGLDRLDLGEEITTRLDTAHFMSAVGQGAVVVESREDDTVLTDILAAINHADTQAATGAERAFMLALEGGCQVPIGAYAVIQNDRLHLDGFVCSLDGRHMVRSQIVKPKNEFEAAGTELARELINLGADKILQEIRA